MKASTGIEVVKILKNKKARKSIKKAPVVHDEVEILESIDDDDADDEVAESSTKKEPIVQHRRDFSSDLMGYISSWNYRETSGAWKFNKILQTWALDNCYDREKIDASVFKALVPYLLSIKGSAVDRLLAKAEEIITKCCEDEEEEEQSLEDAGDETEGTSKKRKGADSAEDNKASSLKRAIKIKFEFSKLKKV